MLRNTNPMINAILLLSILICFPGRIYSGSLIDSLETELMDAAGNARLELLLELAGEYVRISPDSAHRIAHEALELASGSLIGEERGNVCMKLGQAFMQIADYSSALDYFERGVTAASKGQDSDLTANLHRYAGICNAETGNLDKAQEYFKAAYVHWDIAGDAKKKGKLLIAIGNVYYMKDNYEQTIEYYLRSMHLSEAEGDSFTMAVTMGNIGSLYSDLGEYEKALEYCFSALKLSAEETAPALFGDTYNNIGVIYEELDSLDAAFEYDRKSAFIYSELGQPFKTIFPLHNMGVVCIKQNNFDRALEYLMQALELEKQAGAVNPMAKTLVEIGRAYLYSERLNEALPYLKDGLKKSKEIESKSAERIALKALYEYYQQRGDDTRSLEYFKSYHDVDQEIYNKESSEKIASIQARYENAKNEKEIEILKRDQNIQKLSLKEQAIFRNLLLGGLGALLIFSLVILKMYLRLKKAVQEIKFLSGLLPICAHCKKIRDDSGYWNQLEEYIAEHSDAQFSHGICPDCVRELYPEYAAKNSKLSDGK